MGSQDAVQINININIIIGDVTGSAVIQGSDGNTVEVAAGGIPADVLDVLQRLTRQKNGA